MHQYRKTWIVLILMVFGLLQLKGGSGRTVAVGQSKEAIGKESGSSHTDVLAVVSKELRRNRYRAHWHMQAATAYHMLGDAYSREREIEEATKSDPQSPFFQVALADIREERGDIPGAITAMQRAVSLDPKNPVSRCGLARLLEMIGEAAEAIREYQACKDNYHFSKASAFAPHSSGAPLGSEGNEDWLALSREFPCLEKIKVVKQPFYIDPDGGAYPVVVGLREYAMAQILRIETHGPSTTPPLPTISAKTAARSDPQANCPPSPDPITALNEARQKLSENRNPEWAFWHNKAAQAYFSLGNFSAAFGEVDAALRTDPLFIPAYYYGAQISSFLRPKAEPDFLTKALALDAQNPVGHFLLGDYFERGQDSERAVREFRRCLESLQATPDDEIYQDPFGYPHSIQGLRHKVSERMARYERPELED